MTTTADRRIEVLRRGIQSYNAGDTGAVLAVLAPDVVCETADGLGNPGRYQGHDGYREWVADWVDAWEDFQNEPLEIVPVGERHVVARVRGSGRGRGSGIEVAMEVGWVYELRDELCVYMSVQPSFERALKIARERESIPGDD